MNINKLREERIRKANEYEKKNMTKTFEEKLESAKNMIRYLKEEKIETFWNFDNSSDFDIKQEEFSIDSYIQEILQESWFMIKYRGNFIVGDIHENELSEMMNELTEFILEDNLKYILHEKIQECKDMILYLKNEEGIDFSDFESKKEFETKTNNNKNFGITYYEIPINQHIRENDIEIIKEELEKFILGEIK